MPCWYPLGQQQPVGEPRQFVVARQLLELQLRFLAHGDVRRNAAITLEHAGLGEPGLAADRKPVAHAILVDAHVLEILERLARVQKRDMRLPASLGRLDRKLPSPLAEILRNFDEFADHAALETGETEVLVLFPVPVRPRARSAP
jgi:hypothetical protein